MDFAALKQQVMDVQDDVKRGEGVYERLAVIETELLGLRDQIVEDKEAARRRGDGMRAEIHALQQKLDEAEQRRQKADAARAKGAAEGRRQAWIMIGALGAAVITSCGSIITALVTAGS